jgi:lysophospholipase L1-like esterase
MNTIRKTTVVRATAVLLLFVALFGALAMQASRTVAAPEDKIPVKILPIGDSNTVGFGKKGTACSADNENQYASYRYWLYGLLQGNSEYAFPFAGSLETAYCGGDDGLYPSPDFGGAGPADVRFIGWSRQTTESINTCKANGGGLPDNWCLEDGLKVAGLGSSDNVIALIHLGTNDLYWKLAEQKPATAEQLWTNLSQPNLQGILTKLDGVQVNSMKVILAKIVPGDDTTNLTPALVNDWNTKLDAWCNPQGPKDQCSGIPQSASFEVYLVDMNTGFSVGQNNVADEDFQKDDLHLNQAGEEKMAKRWKTAIEKVIGNGVPPKASIKVVKQVINGSAAADWQFAGDLGNFTLDKGGGDKTFTDLDAGNYTITETNLPADWEVAVTCDTGDSGTDSVTVGLQEGVQVVCTFTNTYNGVPLKASIKVVKQVVNGSAAADWQFAGDLGNFTLDKGGGDKTFTDLDAGNYTITETNLPADWEVAVTCDTGDSGTDSVTVNVVEGEQVVCTFVNTYAVDTCDPVPGNVVKNFCFSNRRANWRFNLSSQGRFTVSKDDPYAGMYSAMIRIDRRDGNSQFYQSGIGLEPNTVYELAFAAYSNRGQDMSLWLHDHRGDFTNYGLAGHVVDLTEEWRWYTVTFTTPNRDDMDNARLRFWFKPFAESGAVYHIDRVILRPVEDPCAPVPGNVIANFCFTDGDAPWKLFTAGRGSYAVSMADPYAGAYSAEISIMQPSSNDQFYQADIDLEPNKAYELSFAAYSNDGSNMSLWVNQHRSPFTNYGLSGHRVDLDRDWATYTVTFTTPDRADMQPARLRFWLTPFTGKGTTYHIDRVVLRPVNTP